MANLKIENLDSTTWEQLSADELSQVVGGCGGNSSNITAQGANSNIVNSEVSLFGIEIDLGDTDIDDSPF